MGRGKDLQTAERRRVQILDAAFKCFMGRGYHKTTIDDIARKAGLAKGTVYWYFQDKQDLFISLYRRWFDEALREWDRALVSRKSCGGKIYELGLRMVQMVEREPDSFRAMTELGVQALDNRKTWDFLERFYHEMIAKLESLIREGIREGELRADLDAHSASHYLVDTLDSLDRVFLFKDREMKLRDHWKKVFKILMKGMSA